MLLPGALDPQHVVKQKLILVGGRQPLERTARAAEDHPAKGAHLGADSEVGGLRKVERHRAAPPGCSASGADSVTGAGVAGAGVRKSVRLCRHFMNTYTGIPAISSRKPGAMYS